MVLTLYKLDASPPSRAAMMAIKALGLSDVEYSDVDLLEGAHKTKEFADMNPLQTVPLLKDDDFYIYDSHAIVLYLATKYGGETSLYPSDPQARAIINQRLFFDSGILYPAMSGTVRPVALEGEKSFRPENVAKIRTGYELAERLLTRSWVAGDQLTLADICCYSTISSMNLVLPVDNALYPRLSTWLNKLSQQEFAKQANLSGLEKLNDIFQSKLE